ncbi:MAG: putative ral secretion pathway protein [Verrucomicrobiota bacterium]|jgi:type II secretory pathway component GspD/PulD (secretin)
MNTQPILPLLLTLTLAGGALVRAQAPAAAAPDAPPAPESAPAATERPARDTSAGLRFNFRGAPLETVLNYLSEAAGFVIVLETPVRGTIDMWSAQPVSRPEAVQLLNLAINKSGYTATLKGRTLVVSSKEEARKRAIPIRTGNDPRQIPDNAELVMQIIPLERIDATQAATDLATLLPNSATITANVDSNSLVVTDTQSNVRHIVELLAALDGSAGSVASMRVFQLKNSDPQEMAALINNIFGGGQSGARSGAPQMPGFGGFPGFGGGPGAAIAAMAAARGSGGPGSRGSSSSASRGSRSSGGSSRGTPVVAVADPRTYSVIVSASKETLEDVDGIVRQLDASTARKQKVFVYSLEHGDVKQVESVLRNLFQGSNVRTTGSQEVDPLSTRASANSQATGSNITLGTRGVR